MHKGDSRSGRKFAGLGRIGLKVLETAGLIVRRAEGTKRPCRLSEDGLKAMDQWLAMLR